MSHRRGLYLVPLLGVLVTALRVHDGEPISIVTWHRVDEILAGGTVALVHCGWFGTRAQSLLGRLPVVLAVAAWLVCNRPAAGRCCTSGLRRVACNRRLTLRRQGQIRPTLDLASDGLHRRDFVRALRDPMGSL